MTKLPFCALAPVMRGAWRTLEAATRGSDYGVGKRFTLSRCVPGNIGEHDSYLETARRIIADVAVAAAVANQGTLHLPCDKYRQNDRRDQDGLRREQESRRRRPIERHDVHRAAPGECTHTGEACRPCRSFHPGISASAAFLARADRTRVPGRRYRPSMSAKFPRAASHRHRCSAQYHSASRFPAPHERTHSDRRPA